MCEAKCSECAVECQERVCAKEEDASRLTGRFISTPVSFHLDFIGKIDMRISVTCSMLRNASGLGKWEKAEGRMIFCRGRNVKV